RGHQPVQQETETQPTPTDPAQEEPKHDDAAQHRWPPFSPSPDAAIGASGGPSSRDDVIDNPPCVGSRLSCLRDLGRRSRAGAVAGSPTPPATGLAAGTILTP